MTSWHFDGRMPRATGCRGAFEVPGGGGGGKIVTLPGGGGGGKIVTLPGGGGGKIVTLPGGGGRIAPSSEG